MANMGEQYQAASPATHNAPVQGRAPRTSAVMLDRHAQLRATSLELLSSTLSVRGAGLRESERAASAQCLARLGLARLPAVLGAWTLKRSPPYKAVHPCERHSRHWHMPVAGPCWCPLMLACLSPACVLLILQHAIPAGVLAGLAPNRPSKRDNSAVSSASTVGVALSSSHPQTRSRYIAASSLCRASRNRRCWRREGRTCGRQWSCVAPAKCTAGDGGGRSWCGEWGAGGKQRQWPSGVR